MLQALSGTAQTLLRQLGINYPRTQPKEFKARLKYLHMCVHSGTSYNSQRWTQPRCPSLDDWINQRQSLCTVEYYPAIK